MSKKRGRERNEITQEIKDEIDEIIELKIKEIDGVASKLTFNSVWQFNKKIANNPGFLSSRGKMFNSYSSDFWSTKYRNQNNYGRERILYYKDKASNEILFDGEFDPSIQDIVLAVQDLHSKPDRLIRVLQNIYLEKNRTISILQQSNYELRTLVEKQNSLTKDMENAMYNIFFASRDARNSLCDVISLKKSKDWFIAKELDALVGSRKDFLELLESPESKKQADVIDFNKRYKELEDEGL